MEVTFWPLRCLIALSLVEPATKQHEAFSRHTQSDWLTLQINEITISSSLWLPEPLLARTCKASVACFPAHAQTSDIPQLCLPVLHTKGASSFDPPNTYFRYADHSGTASQLLRHLTRKQSAALANFDCGYHPSYPPQILSANSLCLMH